MNAYPNRQTRVPRQGTTTQKIVHLRPESNSKGLLWTLIGLGLAVAAGVIFWRLQILEKMRTTEREVAALLVSADQLITTDREDEAEAEMRKALALIPGDPRCKAVIERIDTKRKMIHEKKSAASSFARAQAEQIALTDINAAIEALGRMRVDEAYTKEAQQSAADRSRDLKGGVCTLRMPVDWPSDAVLTIDAVTKTPANGVVTGILPGKRTIVITRFGFREPPVMELDFRGLEPLPLPTINWRPRGTKVNLVSRPAGAAVWQNGKDTGKVTPCTIEDVDDGPVEFLFKHPNHADTPVKGEVKDRKPLRLSVSLEPPA